METEILERTQTIKKFSHSTNQVHFSNIFTDSESIVIKLFEHSAKWPNFVHKTKRRLQCLWSFSLKFTFLLIGLIHFFSCRLHCLYGEVTLFLSLTDSTAQCFRSVCEGLEYADCFPQKRFLVYGTKFHLTMRQSSEFLRSVEYHFLSITPRSTFTRSASRY